MASHDDSPFVMQGTGFAFIASRSRRLLGKLKALQSEALNDGFVDEGAALAILDLDDPDVGIKAHPLGEIISASGCGLSAIPPTSKKALIISPSRCALIPTTGASISRVPTARPSSAN